VGELQQGSGPRSLSDIVAAGPGEGGSFVYDETTLRSLIVKWMQLAEHYNGSIHRGSLGTVDPPGKDFASDAMATSANTSGKAYLRYLTRNYWFCVDQAQVLQDALDDYLGTEHHSVLALAKTQTQPADEPAEPGI
jgi:hypothetical protein